MFVSVYLFGDICVWPVQIFSCGKVFMREQTLEWTIDGSEETRMKNWEWEREQPNRLKNMSDINNISHHHHRHLYIFCFCFFCCVFGSLGRNYRSDEAKGAKGAKGISPAACEFCCCCSFFIRLAGCVSVC